MAQSSTVLEPTSVAEIPAIVSRLRTTFSTQKTKTAEFRINQLRKLYWGLDDYSRQLEEALRLDLGKPIFESYVTEIIWAKNDCIFMQKNLEKWMKDEKPPDVPLMMTAVSPRIRKDPLGTVLIIGAYNFPIQLSICPLIGAIAAGCTAVLKPSELSPHTAAVLQKILKEYLDPEAYTVVQGGVTETTALLDQRWEKIFYTGSGSVGTIVAKKAAETLTPVTLELGGLNPAIVTKNADPMLAARRLLWGKTHNAGQVCLSHNYTMVDKEIFDQFIEALRACLNEFYPEGPRKSAHYGRIVNNRHFLRIKKMLDDSKGKILIGGEVDEADNFIAPTVIRVDSTDDSTIIQESFGPLFPVIPVENLDEAIKTANEVCHGPLAMYGFGSKSEVDKMLLGVLSGGASINDSFFHGSIATLPFGGVGESGTGSYRGRASFDTFTHRRTVTTTPSWMEKMIAFRYPPFSSAKLNQFRNRMGLKPDFDRNGNPVKGLGYWLGFILTLGGGDLRRAVVRWVTAVAVAVFAKRHLDQKATTLK